MYDTQMPLNINDDDLSEDPNAPPPVERQGFTEMTFPIIRFQVLAGLGWIFRNDPGTSKCKDIEPMTVQQKEEMIESKKKLLYGKYLEGVDLSQPIQKVTHTVWLLIMGKALLSLYHPLRHYKDGEFLSHEVKEKYVSVHSFIHSPTCFLQEETCS